MPAYVTPDRAFDVFVVRDPDNRLDDPTPDEATALDAYFASPDATDPETGQWWALLGQPLPGVPDGCVMYPVRPVIDSADAPDSRPPSHTAQ
jgi:hypothetical protein